jgi:hypothetical protein
MIKLEEVCRVETHILAMIDDETRAYTIDTDFLSDSCKPYEVARNHTMIWLDERGFLGEIECLAPTIVQKPPCHAQEVSHQEGFPRLAILSQNNISAVQLIDDGYIIWLEEGKMIDTEVQYKTLQFLFAGGELTGIVAHDVIPEQDINF